MSACVTPGVFRFAEKCKRWLIYQADAIIEAPAAIGVSAADDANERIE